MDNEYEVFNELNNSVQNMNVKPPENICKPLYEFSNLKVLAPPLDYIAGMKLVSAREQDIQDVAFILQKLKITSPDAFRKTLSEYGFSSIDESLLLESFGLAYGMEWLEKYYIDHEEEILGRLKTHYNI